MSARKDYSYSSVSTREKEGWKYDFGNLSTQCIQWCSWGGQEDRSILC